MRMRGQLFSFVPGIESAHGLAHFPSGSSPHSRTRYTPVRSKRSRRKRWRGKSNLRSLYIRLR